MPKLSPRIIDGSVQGGLVARRRSAGQKILRSVFEFAKRLIRQTALVEAEDATADFMRVHLDRIINYCVAHQHVIVRLGLEEGGYPKQLAEDFLSGQNASVPKQRERGESGSTGKRISRAIVDQSEEGVDRAREVSARAMPAPSVSASPTA